MSAARSPTRRPLPTPEPSFCSALTSPPYTPSSSVGPPPLHGRQDREPAPVRRSAAPAPVGPSPQFNRRSLRPASRPSSAQESTKGTGGLRQSPAAHARAALSQGGRAKRVVFRSRSASALSERVSRGLGTSRLVQNEPLPELFSSWNHWTLRKPGRSPGSSFSHSVRQQPASASPASTHTRKSGKPSWRPTADAPDDQDWGGMGVEEEEQARVTDFMTAKHFEDTRLKVMNQHYSSEEAEKHLRALLVKAREVTVLPEVVSKVHESLGQLLFRRGEHFRARDEFEYALLQEPNNVAAMCHLAHCCEASGDLEGAEAHFTNAVSRAEASQTATTVHYDFAEFLHRQGRRRDASEQLNRARHPDLSRRDLRMRPQTIGWDFRKIAAVPNDLMAVCITPWTPRDQDACPPVVEPTPGHEASLGKYFQAEPE